MRTFLALIYTVKGLDEEAFMCFRIAATLFPAATLEDPDLELISFALISVGHPTSALHNQARIMGLK